MSQILGGARHDQMSWVGLQERGKHRANTAEVNPRYRDAYNNGGYEQEHILDDADPRHSSDSAHKYKSRDQGKADDHSGCAMDCSKARDFYDDPQACDLNLDVRDEANNTHERYERAQVRAAITHLEEISLRLQPVPLPGDPNWGENEE